MSSKTLHKWKEHYPRPFSGERDAKGKRIREQYQGEHLVFPNGSGKPENTSNIAHQGLHPAQITAGVCDPVCDENGKPLVDVDGNPVMKARYTGMHALRHFYASWCINRKVDGGLELPLKTVQARMGHSNIAITADTYGHLFPSKNDADELADGEKALLSHRSATRDKNATRDT